MVENLGLARLGLGDERLVKHVQDVLAHPLKLRLNLLAVVTNGGNMLIGALGLFLLLNGRDDSPGSTSRSHDILVGHRQQIPLVHGEFAAQLSSHEQQTRTRLDTQLLPWPPPSCTRPFHHIAQPARTVSPRMSCCGGISYCDHRIQQHRVYLSRYYHHHIVSTSSFISSYRNSSISRRRASASTDREPHDVERGAHLVGHGDGSVKDDEAGESKDLKRMMVKNEDTLKGCIWVEAEKLTVDALGVDAG